MGYLTKMIEKSGQNGFFRSRLSILGQIPRLRTARKSHLFQGSTTDVLREKMHAENGYSWVREVHHSIHQTKIVRVLITKQFSHFIKPFFVFFTHFRIFQFQGF